MTHALHGSSGSVPVVLVTGATGFLGSALVVELLRRRPDVEVLCLVRGAAEADASALDRLRSRLVRAGATREELAQVTGRNILSGDLGASESVFDTPEARRTTHVVNCAALVTFAWRRDVWHTNVEATEQFAASAARLPHLRRFVHVSTALVSGNATSRHIREAQSPGDARQLTLYTKSKAAIEQRLATVLGERLVIARPSVVVGHSALGCTASASLFWLFRMIHAAGRVPFPPERRIDVVPVDHCARALRRLCLNDHLSFNCYHISAGRLSSSFTEIDGSYGAATGTRIERPLQYLELDEFESMRRVYETWFGPCDPQAVSGAIRVYSAFAGLDVTFDNERLMSEGVPPPPRFTDYLARCVVSSGVTTIAEQMQQDLR